MTCSDGAPRSGNPSGALKRRGPMRITIDIDSSNVFVGSTSQANAATTNAESAGAAPESSSSATSTGSDAAKTGGPPQWLQDAVSKAIAKAGDTVTGASAAQDGGSGPA